MALFSTIFLYTLTPGGTNQYTVNGEITNGQASGDAGDNTISVNETVPVTFTTHNELDGNYTYLGHEPGLPGYVAEGPDGNFYLFSNVAVPPNQNFNIQAEDIPVCFLPGTLIATPEGPVAIERLAIGDLLLTADGRSVPVKWLGRQTVASPFGMPEGRLPVAIEAGALGDDLPVRDLRLTSDHALLIDGVLVQAGALVNGTTIRRIPNAELGHRFTVYHIETENHEVVLAEGTPAETFIDNVTRSRFDNYAEYETMFGAVGTAMEDLPQPRAMSARQVPASIRLRVAQRAAAHAVRLTEAA